MEFMRGAGLQFAELSLALPALENFRPLLGAVVNGEDFDAFFLDYVSDYKKGNSK